MIRQNATGELPLPLRARIDIDEYYDQIIVPYRNAPVIIAESGELILKSMRFSMTPRWSKEAKVKFATHNARLESIAEKPTWRDSFAKRHCVVPITDFIEPIYEGDHAGHMVAFHRSKPGWLLAAGIYDEWTDKQTGEVIESFAIITTEPPKFIAETGHDRCPVFVHPEGAKHWLTQLPPKAEAMIKELLGEQDSISYAVDNVRPMKPGWEKRK